MSCTAFCPKAQPIDPVAQAAYKSGPAVTVGTETTCTTCNNNDNNCNYKTASANLFWAKVVIGFGPTPKVSWKIHYKNAQSIMTMSAYSKASRVELVHGLAH